MFERIKKSNEITARKNFEERLRKFDQIKALNEETKGAIRPYIANYQKDYVSFVTKVLNFSRIYIWLLIPFAGLFALCPLLILYTLYPQVFRHTNFIGYLLMIANLFLSSVILTMIIRTNSSVLERYTEFHFIKLYISTIIIDIIYSTEINPDVWIEIEYKRIQLGRIEKLAGYIEHGLPGQLRSGDIVTDDWFKDTTREIAAALREKKKWILTPTKNTREDLLRSLASALVCVLYGDWDALERLKLKDLVHPPLWFSIATSILKFLKVLLKAGFLLGFFVVLQHTPWALPGTTYVTIITLSILYAVTVFLSASNPDFDGRVSNVKDIGGLLPFLGSGPKS